VITSAVRGIAATALGVTCALLPTQAQAEEKDEDNDIEVVELTGTARDYAPPPGATTASRWLSHLAWAPLFWVPVLPTREGDSWATRLDLYTVDKTKKTQLYAGDGESDCTAVRVRDNRVTAQCTRVLRLKKGSLTLSDIVTHEPGKPATAKTAIIGGTGHYRSAYGEGRITFDGSRLRLRLDVDE
jgi:hypothetical protein